MNPPEGDCNLWTDCVKQLGEEGKEHGQILEENGSSREEKTLGEFPIFFTSTLSAAPVHACG